VDGQRKAEADANAAIAKIISDAEAQQQALQAVYDQYTKNGVNTANQQELDQLTPEQLVNRLKQIKPQ
jgi:regulator of extracellular matrix RemA (YlzA/DUF370 family)